jgi:hypothetical protein
MLSKVKSLKIYLLALMMFATVVSSWSPVVSAAEKAEFKQF